MHDLIAVSVATAGLSSLDPATQPAPGLVRKVLQIERVHGALEANMQLADLALRQSDNLDAGKAQPLEDRRRVLLVARQAVEGLGQNDRESDSECIGQQSLNARPQ